MTSPCPFVGVSMRPAPGGYHDDVTSSDSRVRVGTSGWRFAGWRGDSYLAGLRQRDELAYVAGVLSSVGPARPGSDRGDLGVASEHARRDPRPHPRPARGAAAGTAPRSAWRGPTTTSALPAGVRRRGRHARRPARARRPGPLPVHRQGRPAGELPVRACSPCRASEVAPGARLLRYDGPADRGRLHRATTSTRGPSVMARSIRAAGGRPGDIVHVAYGYGLFTGGLGAHYGAERLGCTVVPVSRRHDRAAGAADRRLRAARDHGDAVVLPGDPRRDGGPGRRPARDLAGGRHLRRRAVDRPDATRASRSAAASSAVDIYGLSEVMGPGICQESGRDPGRAAHLGGPLPARGDRPGHREVLPDGEEGELVFTSLTKQAMPVIRYRTRDLTRLLPGTAYPPSAGCRRSPVAPTT